MEPIKINIIAILIAVVVNFILGWLWYTPLFGKLWGREMGYDMNEKPASSELMKGMVFMIIGNFLFAWVLLIHKDSFLGKKFKHLLTNVFR